MKPSDYYSPDLLTSASTLNQTDGSFISYKAEGYRSFVNIRGGNIFGNVYGGGVGCKKAEANQYYNIGRINGNTLVHIVNSNPGVDSGIDNVVPCVWGDIYGGCEYGTATRLCTSRAECWARTCMAEDMATLTSTAS